MTSAILVISAFQCTHKYVCIWNLYIFVLTEQRTKREKNNGEKRSASMPLFRWREKQQKKNGKTGTHCRRSVAHMNLPLSVLIWKPNHTFYYALSSEQFAWHRVSIYLFIVYLNSKYQTLRWMAGGRCVLREYRATFVLFISFLIRARLLGTYFIYLLLFFPSAHRLKIYRRYTCSCWDLIRHFGWYISMVWCITMWNPL